jgi:alpha-1,6-mannosyltransferase
LLNRGLPASVLTILAGGALLALSVILGFLPLSQSAWLRIALLGSVACGALLLAAYFSWPRDPGGRWTLFILGVALAGRLLLFPAGHELSDDAARYHWDGKLLSHGINPFRFSPEEFLTGTGQDDPASGETRVPRHTIDERINHPELPTCYPPLAQLLFAAAYRLSPGRLLGWRILSLLAELACWLLLLRELTRRALPRSRLLLAAWIPLSMIEGYLPGHSDTLGLPLLVLFISDLSEKRAWRAGLWLALAAMIKPLPLLFLPALLRELGWRRSMRALTSLALVLAVFHLPFAGAGERLFSSIWLMAGEWSFGGGLGALIETLLPMGIAHLVSALLIGAVAVIGAWRGRDLPARLIAAIIGLVAFTPTLFPWYLIWALPLLALRPNLPLLAFCLLAPLAEWVQIDYQALGVWAPPLWPQLLQYGVFFGLLLLGAGKNSSRLAFRSGSPVL